MDLTWLEDFAALAETGNFSRAAEARHCTQPAFSRRIRALEDWVGAPLFDRSANPVRLTEAGERFHPAAAEAWRHLMQARDQAREAAHVAETQLVVAATHALSLLFFPAWLKHLEKRGAVAPVRLVSDSQQDCEELMAQGGAQFLLCHHHPAVPGRMDDHAFIATNVGKDLLVPVAAPGVIESLTGELPYLAYSAQSGMGRILAAQLRQRTPLALKPVFTSHLSVVLRAMARDGRGLAWLPLSLVSEDIADGRLTRIGGGDWTIPVEIRLFRPRARQSPAAEAFWSLAAGS
ncbi:MAG: LysR substrate-binding domain-containing protein [Magnetospirillum sp.]|nr:LysR substrate-binding domain-containing protein [Magnetospirillum sp.]